MKPAELGEVRADLLAFVEEMFASLPRSDQRRWGETYLRGLMLDSALHSRRSVHMFTVHALSALSFFGRRLARQSCSILSHRRSAPSTSTCAPA